MYEEMMTPCLEPRLVLEPLIEPLEPAVVTSAQTLEPSAVVTLPSAEPSQCKDPPAKLCLSRDQLQFEYVYCQEYDKVCPFWVVNLKWARHRLHLDMKRGPWTCFCQTKAKLDRTVNSDSPNSGRMYLTCQQKQQCHFFQWLVSPWSDKIFEFRLKDARKSGWV